MSREISIFLSKM